QAFRPGLTHVAPPALVSGKVQHPRGPWNFFSSPDGKRSHPRSDAMISAPHGTASLSLSKPVFETRSKSVKGRERLFDHRITRSRRSSDLVIWIPRCARDCRKRLIVRAHLGLAHAQLLVFVLELVELPVDAAVGEQLLVAADLAHLAFVHDDDLVGALDGGEP